MSIISIRSFKDNKVIFSGDFDGYAAALEVAVGQGIDLSYADLRQCNLKDVNLDDGRFCNANFKGANLSGANMSEADLSGADFSGATLYNSCFAYANMRGTNFSRALFGATDITGADLSNSVFAGRSCFSLEFILAEKLEGSLYRDDVGRVHSLSAPPVVINGVKPQPMVLFHGASVFIQVGANRKCF